MELCSFFYPELEKIQREPEEKPMNRKERRHAQQNAFKKAKKSTANADIARNYASFVRNCKKARHV